MHFHQSSFLLGAAALAGAVAVPAPIPDDVPVTVADIPTPSVLGADPLVYSSIAPPVNAETVTAAVTGETVTPTATDISSTAAAGINPSLVALITDLPSSIPPSLYSHISAAVPTDPASVAAIQSALAKLPSGVLPAQLASLASALLPAPSAGTKVKRDVAYNSASAVSKCSSNHWDCCTLPTGTAFPQLSSDTVQAFQTNNDYSSAAIGAKAPTGYGEAFNNLQGATQQDGYRGVYLLNTYSPNECATHCNNDAQCMSFNVYVERDPIVRPDYPGQDSACSNPPSTANVKCTLYGLPVSSQTATNKGQWQGGFQVVIAASNGYNKVTTTTPDTVVPLPDFSGPYGSKGNTVSLPGAIEDLSTYYLYEFYTGPYDPANCAKGCKANTAYNKEHLRDDNGRYTACNAFNAYITYADGVAKGTTCAYYSDNIVPTTIESKATNVGQYQGSVHITIGQSFVYNLSPRDSGDCTAVCGSTSDYPCQHAAQNANTGLWECICEDDLSYILRIIG
ncbi:hypothetical protein SLS57_006621 [Botryosphaeria dothidea]